VYCFREVFCSDDEAKFANRRNGHWAITLFKIFDWSICRLADQRADEGSFSQVLDDQSVLSALLRLFFAGPKNERMRNSREY
jgi:hypothetical protein